MRKLLAATAVLAASLTTACVHGSAPAGSAGGPPPEVMDAVMRAAQIGSGGQLDNGQIVSQALDLAGALMR